MPELRWYQTEACAAAWSHLCGQAGNPLIVLPTGAGKSLVIAELCRQAVQGFNGRVLILAHRSELLQQNSAAIASLLPPEVSLGIYSAGLKSRDTDNDVICAGIQSVYKRAGEFGSRQMVLLDESHLVSTNSDTMYRKFLSDLRAINPKLKVVGLTATPYRTDSGPICRPDGVFQKICYEAPIQQLIAEGYLSHITNVAGDASYDTSRLHMRGGEFIASEVEELFGSQVTEACQEIAAKTKDRHSVLVFCSGVEHAENVANCLREILGEPVKVVVGDTPEMERAETLARFRTRQLRVLCNVDVLTTGFDAPCIDAIAILRATCSPGLFAQIVGRGFRKHPDKENCTVLDFGENLKRHGPIDAVGYGKAKPKPAAAGDAPVKKCPNCEAECPLSARECLGCGWNFPERTIKHETEADEQSQILVAPKRWDVDEVRMGRHKSKKSLDGAHDTLRVEYLCTPIDGGLPVSISEWVCIDHEGYAGRKASQWWCKRCLASPESDDHGSFIDSCVDLFKRGAVATPSQITTIRDGHWNRVTHYVLDEPPETWSEEVLDEMEIPF